MPYTYPTLPREEPDQFSSLSLALVHASDTEYQLDSTALSIQMEEPPAQSVMSDLMQKMAHMSAEELQMVAQQAASLHPAPNPAQLCAGSTAAQGRAEPFRNSLPTLILTLTGSEPHGRAATGGALHAAQACAGGDKQRHD